MVEESVARNTCYELWCVFYCRMKERFFLRYIYIFFFRVLLPSTRPLCSVLPLVFLYHPYYVKCVCMSCGTVI